MRLCAFADEASTELLGQIDALNRNGIGLLEIRGVDKENIKEISLNKIKQIGNTLKENGIGVWSIGSPVGKYAPDDNFPRQCEELKMLAEYAHILGAQRIRMFSFFTDNEEIALERLEKFCEIVPKDIILCHENEKGIFGQSYESCVKIHKAFPRIRSVFDPANFVQCDVNTLEAWDALSPYVDYLHIKDALADKRVVKAGYGIGNVEKIISMYIKNGGDVLTLEPHLMEFHGLKGLENGESINHIEVYPDSDTAFDAGANALKDILNRLGVKY